MSSGPMWSGTSGLITNCSRGTLTSATLFSTLSLPRAAVPSSAAARWRARAADAPHCPEHVHDPRRAPEEKARDQPPGSGADVAIGEPAQGKPHTQRRDEFDA